MTGKWAVESLEIVGGEWLADYLAEQGLEVTRGQWLKGSPYPVLFVRPKQAERENTTDEPDSWVEEANKHAPPARARLEPERGLNELAHMIEKCAECGHRRVLHTEDENPLTGEPLGCFAWECTCRKFVPAGGAQ